MKYYIDVMYKLNKNNMLCIVFDIISLALGLMIGVIFLAEANVLVRDRESDDRLLNKDQFVVYEPSIGAEKIQNDKLLEMEKRTEGIQNILVENRLSDYVLKYNNRFCMDAAIVSVSDNFEAYVKPEAIKGKMIEQGNEILIGESIAERYDIHIGDTVEIDIYTFLVCGIAQVAKYKNTAVCLHSELSGVQYADCTYYVKADEQGRKKFDNELKQEGYADDINYVKVRELGQEVFKLKRGGRDYICYSPEEASYKEDEYFKSGWKPSILIAMVSLFYALLNIMNVELFFAMKQKKFIAVMQALGAAKWKMVLSKVFYSLFVSFFSSILAVSLTWGLQKTEFRYLVNMDIDARLIVAVIVFSQISYALFCYILYDRIYRKSVVNILLDG
ncbi:MAG: ABC transporter permease [Lachnospiraceae bacterium]|nr:ABC transporter permease [Lachnospiraceae bacterium]